MILVFTCPHCNEYFEMLSDELNCRIVRHAIYINNLMQINPHASKSECDMLRSRGLIIGCAGPIKIENDENGKLHAVKCEYI